MMRTMLIKRRLSSLFCPFFGKMPLPFQPRPYAIRVPDELYNDLPAEKRHLVSLVREEGKVQLAFSMTFLVWWKFQLKYFVRFLGRPKPWHVSQKRHYR